MIVYSVSYNLLITLFYCLNPLDLAIGGAIYLVLWIWLQSVLGPFGPFYF
jgi:hypothetical protein